MVTLANYFLTLRAQKRMRSAALGELSGDASGANNSNPWLHWLSRHPGFRQVVSNNLLEHYLTRVAPPPPPVYSDLHQPVGTPLDAAATRRNVAHTAAAPPPPIDGAPPPYTKADRRRAESVMKNVV